MQFRSTRGGTPPVSFSEALTQGLAPDGGLYLPESWPRLDVDSFPDADDLPAVAKHLIAPFAAGDPLEHELDAITREAFSFPAPLVPVGKSGRLHVLELFHGPTAAFKDFGARFLAASLSRLRKGAARPLRILVATSGDTGGAVAAAFHGRPGIEVVVLFPKGLVSPTQQQQLTCWGDNVHSFAVRGTFDDCQRMVKEAFLDPTLRSEAELSSANSINLGRLLPQAVYYASTSLAVFRKTGEAPSFVIPSGNLGNAVACVWARLLGLPIGEIVLAHGANRMLVDYLETGTARPRPSVPTLASAMDVGNPSNFERLIALHPSADELRKAVSATSIDDGAISARIRDDYQAFGETWCPHTATAAETWNRLPQQRREKGRWVIVSTAHPAKFSETVNPLRGSPVPVPSNLQELFDRPAAFEEIDANLEALRKALGSGAHG
ncbi:MAG: threonine synthase, partial [Steroidobacteraceae bacterium]